MAPPEAMSARTARCARAERWWRWEKRSRCSVKSYPAEVLQIEELELSVSPLELTFCLQIEHSGYESVLGIEDQGVQGTLGTRPGCGSVLRERKLKTGMQLDTFAAGAGIIQENPPATYVAAGHQGR